MAEKGKIWLSKFKGWAVLDSQIGKFHYQTGKFHSQIGKFHYQTGKFHSQIGKFHFQIGKFHSQIGKFHYQTGKIPRQIGVDAGILASEPLKATFWGK